MQFPQRCVAVSALAAALFPVSTPATAALPTAVDIAPVMVTATRTARTQDQALAAVTVIGREEIERLQPQSLPDLLRGRAGISLANNGGPGKATSLFLRGTESDHVLVLVDGVKIGSATSGGAALQDIPVEQIERVEIVRGPFSSLYGSEALGGVVQIFTRRPQGPFEPRFSVGVGSDKTRRASFGMAGRSADGAAWYSLHGAHGTTDGIDARRDNPASSFDDASLDPDLDGYRNNSVTAQGGYRFNTNWEAEARLLRSEGHNEYDGGASAGDESDTVQQTVGGLVRYTPTGAFRLTVSAGTSADQSDNFYQGAFNSNFDTERELGGVQADLGLGGGLLTVGFDWQRDEVDSSTAYDRTTRINRGAFGQWQGAFGSHSLQASARRDDDSQFGGETTGSVLWGLDLSQALRLTASYGTGFKSPTFNELYFPGYGNPMLGPETSRSVELGLRGEFDGGVWSLNAFETRIDDLIAYDADFGDSGGPSNIDRARIRGVEAALDIELAGWDVRTSATALEPENDAGSAGKVLPRRARRSGRIDIDRSFGNFSVGASGTGAGERFDNLANTTRLPGYGLLELRAGYAFGDDWQVRVSLDNVFDRDYETAAFYRQPGRTWLLTLRYHPAR